MRSSVYFARPVTLAAPSLRQALEPAAFMRPRPFPPRRRAKAARPAGVGGDRRGQPEARQGGADILETVAGDQHHDLVARPQQARLAQLGEGGGAGGGRRLGEHPARLRQEALAGQDLAVLTVTEQPPLSRTATRARWAADGTETEIESAMVAGWAAPRYRPVTT